MSHDHQTGSDPARRLALAAGLTGGFMVLEAVGGWLTGSLALLADAGHMLTDTAALGLAWLAARIAMRPADWKRTFGFDRFSVLAGFVNGIALFVIALLILREAVLRFADPVPVLGLPMLAIAVAGLAVNLVALKVLGGHEGHSHGDLNTRAAALHVMGDLLGSAGAILAAILIMAFGWTAADPVLSVLVSLLILNGAWRVVVETGRILLEATPEGLDPRTLAADLQGLPGVDAIHHVHAWSITEKRRMVTLHARLAADAPLRATAHAIRTRLKEVHGVGHATIEIEPADPPLSPM